MKPHPRIRKTIKWGGAAVTVLLVVVWIGSGWRVATWVCASGVQIAAGRGQVFLQQWRLPLPYPQWLQGGSFTKVRPSEWLWSFGYGTSDLIAWGINLPLWCPTAIAIITTTLAWRLEAIARRRARLNLCPKCNYDRAGIAGDAKCPECGCGGASGGRPKGA